MCQCLPDQLIIHGGVVCESQHADTVGGGAVRDYVRVCLQPIPVFFTYQRHDVDSASFQFDDLGCCLRDRAEHQLFCTCGGAPVIRVAPEQHMLAGEPFVEQERPGSDGCL